MKAVTAGPVTTPAILAAEAVRLGIGWVIWNDETSPNPAVMLPLEAAAYATFQASGLQLVWAPTATCLENILSDGTGTNQAAMVANADAILYQCQSKQNNPPANFPAIVLTNYNLIKGYKSMPIWIQFGVNPPHNPNATASQVEDDINALTAILIPEYIVIIFEGSHPSSVATMESVIGVYRP
jgi:hypothetical protein